MKKLRAEQLMEKASGLSAMQLMLYIKSPKGAKSINEGWSPSH
jgi:hypothetical protein